MIMTLSRVQVSFKIYSRNIMHAHWPCPCTSMSRPLHIVFLDWEVLVQCRHHWASWKPYPGPGAGVLLVRHLEVAINSNGRDCKLGSKLATLWVHLQKATMLPKTHVSPFPARRDKQAKCNMNPTQGNTILFEILFVSKPSRLVWSVKSYSPELWFEFDHFLFALSSLSLAFLTFGDWKRFPTQI